MRMQNKFAAFFLFLLCAPLITRADAAIFLAEPYGSLAKVSPTGHVAVYLDRVCAASPTELRRCRAGELGAVISRYNKVGGYDWVAIPLMPYLYAAERAEDVPAFVDAQTVEFLRNQFRKRYLRELAPDEEDGQPPKGNWVQLVGAAYDRRIFAFEIETSEAQDDAFILKLNAQNNRGRFNPLWRNCADFVKDAINFYYPKAVRRSIIADAGITTPKQVAKSLVRYGKKHPGLYTSAFQIPQVPGSLPRSKGVRGVLEAIVKSKKYAVPLVAVHLGFAPGLAIGYFTTGRFNPARNVVTVYRPAELELRALWQADNSAAPAAHRPFSGTGPGPAAPR